MTAPLTFDVSLPPLLTSRPVVPPIDPMHAALQALGSGRAEAGDLFWSADASEISYAIVLEPEVDRDRAQEMLFVTMTAMGDAIGAIVPPELALTWRWPCAIFANGARLGRARMAISDHDDDTGTPAWMVVAVTLALKPDNRAEPGKMPDKTSLWDEGAVDLDIVPALESIARHLLTWIHRWESDGFKPVHEAWLFRCDGYREEVALQTGDGAFRGLFSGLDESGNLLLKPQDAPARVFQVTDHLTEDRTARPLVSVTGN